MHFEPPVPGPARDCPTDRAELGLDLTPVIRPGAAGLRGRALQAAGVAVVTAAREQGLHRFDGAPGLDTLLTGHGSTGDSGIRATLRVRSAREAQSACERFPAGVELDLLAEGSALLSDAGLWTGLHILRDAGLCRRVGIQAGPGADAVGLARRFKPVVMQVACGLLDQRLVRDGGLETLAALGIELQLRTALLHGLLFLPREALPGSLADVGPQVSRARRLIAEAGADPLQAALAFALRRKEAAAVIVEAGSTGEVKALAAAAAAPAPDLEWPALALDHPAALDAEAELSRTLAA